MLNESVALLDPVPVDENEKRCVADSVVVPVLLDRVLVFDFVPVIVRECVADPLLDVFDKETEEVSMLESVRVEETGETVALVDTVWLTVAFWLRVPDLLAVPTVVEPVAVALKLLRDRVVELLPS